MKLPCKIFFLLFLSFSPGLLLIVNAQTDTVAGQKIEQNKLVRKLMDALKKDTSEVDVARELERNDKVYEDYEGLIIRNIVIERFPFGTSLRDTTNKLTNTLTDLANSVHHLTKIKVVRRNLFFKENDYIHPFLFADNARFLRQLPYFQDADIIVTPVHGQPDSADVLVIVKDIFSLGGAIGSLGLKNTQLEMREDNFAGSGNSAVLFGAYDVKRQGHTAFGGEYVRRNIGGSFLDGKAGYQSYYRSIPGPRQENFYYMNVSKELVNRFMNWTYEFKSSYHSTHNLYTSDSLYQTDFRYRYSNVEAWAGLNLHSKKFTKEDEKNHLRKIIGMRFISNQFQTIPLKYNQQYNWRYADLTALLGSVTFYRQDFYKTQYIYGFGRNEDIPEGILLTLTTGYTLKENRSRPFMAFNYERYRFNRRDNYIGYKLRAEGYVHKKSIEDLNFLVAINYFDNLKSMGTRWKQRFFLNLDVAQQVNTVLNEPLYINSTYGLPEFGLGEVGGTLRATAKAESVFFSPYSWIGFKLAPFVFGNVSVFSPYLRNSGVYPSLGSGIRTRNESLVFGTIELKFFYFPKKNYHKEHFNLEISTNVIFKYDKTFLKKPDFIEIN